jgi:hypothetical protein
LKKSFESHYCFLFEFESLMEFLLQHMYLGLHDPLERVKGEKKTLEDLVKVDRIFFPPSCFDA